MFTTIKTLWQQGNNKSEIAKLTGHDWKTVNKIIRQVQKGINRPTKKPHHSKLDDYVVCVIEFLLGISLAVVGFTEKSYSQIICDSKFLGRLSIFKQFIGIITKGLSVAIITYFISNNGIIFITPFLSIFFILSGIILILSMERKPIKMYYN